MKNQKNPEWERERLTKMYEKIIRKDKIEKKLLNEINKYQEKKGFESGLSNYCLNVIDSNDKLNRFEKNSFSEILSRWALEERLEQHRETKRYLRNKIKAKLQELCESAWDNEEEMLDFLLEESKEEAK